MSLKLYYDLLSQPCRAVYIFMKVTNIPFQDVQVSLVKGANLTDEFKRISKFQKVPAIDDNGFKLIESVAILRYLSKEKSVDNHWYPKESQAQAKVDEYLEWQHHNTRFLCNFYVERKYLMPLQTGVATSEHLVNESKDRMLNCIDKLENIWLERNKFLAGNVISIADLVGVCELEQTRVTGFDPKKNFPRVAEWMENVRKLTNPYYDEAHKILYKISERNKA